MRRLAILFAAVLAVSVGVQAAEPPQEASAAIERLLHGPWKWGACLGDWTFNADGTYDLSHYTPAGLHLTGTWKLTWDALPPTLSFTCKTSDDPELVGKEWDVKVIQLDEEILRYQHGDGPPLRCTREPTRR